MIINDLFCNGRINPTGTGYDAVLSWNYSTDYRRNLTQSRFRIEVSLDKEFITPVHDSGTVISDEMNYDLGSVMKPESSRLYWWRVTATGNDGQTTASRPAFFETALLDPGLWDSYGSYWITGKDDETAAPVFFNEIERMSGKIKSARAYIYSFGFSYLYVNKKRCSDRLLSPPNTRYDKRCLYQTYDITEQLSGDEKNLIEIHAGAGYGETYSKWGWRFMGKKGVRGVFLITFEDGRVIHFATDANWSMRAGKTEMCDIYNGETYNASLNGFTFYGVAADNSLAPSGTPIPDTMPNIVPYDSIAPVSAWETGDQTIFDFGVNIAGFAEITAEAERGTRITLEFAETVEPDGSWNPKTNRAALATDVYICSGTGREKWHPGYTYHGFRYVRISGLKNTVSFDITACAFCADLRVTGSFGCSDAAVNRIHEHCLRSMRANLMSIPTDCPMRDERTPCSMDSQTTEEAAVYNFDMLSYYTKWAGDIAGDGGNPDWAGDQIYLVWRLYRYYGDKSIVSRHYDKLKNYMLQLEKESDHYLWEKGFGDWCHPNNNTWDSFFGSVTAVNTCLFYSMAVKMEYLAGIMGSDEDAARFSRMAVQIKSAFSERCINEDGTVLSGEMTEQLMPLYFKMADEETSKKIYGKLMEIIGQKNYMDTGIYGTMALLDVLSESGHYDKALELITQPAYPGFVWQIANGATSLWEQWAHSGSMHSHNHGFFAGIDASFYKRYGGVETIKPAFRSFKVKPELPEAMSWTECSLLTASGKIEVKTTCLSCGTEMNLTIPPNTSADVWLPVPDGEYVLFDGERELDTSCFEQRGKYLRCVTGSGVYRFRAVAGSYVR